MDDLELTDLFRRADQLKVRNAPAALCSFVQETGPDTDYHAVLVEIHEQLVEAEKRLAPLPAPPVCDTLGRQYSAQHQAAVSKIEHIIRARQVRIVSQFWRLFCSKRAVCGRSRKSQHLWPPETKIDRRID